MNENAYYQSVTNLLNRRASRYGMQQENGGSRGGTGGGTSTRNGKTQSSHGRTGSGASHVESHQVLREVAA